jgi:hypothetical protein
MGTTNLRYCTTTRDATLLDDLAAELELTYGPGVCVLDGSTLLVDHRHPQADDAWKDAREMLREWRREARAVA